MFNHDQYAAIKEIKAEDYWISGVETNKRWMSLAQGSPAWMDARSKMLTASDFGAALGINPYCSRQRLWRIKMGLETVGDNIHIQRGRENERHAIHAYEVDSGHLVDAVGLVVHPDHPWLGASPDGLVGDRGLVEIKCPSAFRGEPPEYHLAQIQGQLEITDRDWCDYAQWVEGTIRVVRVYRDADWWASALPKLVEFWDCVQRMESPPRTRRAV